MASNKSKTPGPIQVVVVLMLSVLAFYFGNRFGQVFDFNTMEITDGALATVNSIVAAPAAISTASVPMLYAIGLAITVLIVWLYTFMYAGNYRYGEEAGSAKWGTLKEPADVSVYAFSRVPICFHRRWNHQYSKERSFLCILERTHGSKWHRRNFG